MHHPSCFELSFLSFLALLNSGNLRIFLVTFTRQMTLLWDFLVFSEL